MIKPTAKSPTSVLNRLAHSQNRRDEERNVALAKELAAARDKAGIREIDGAPVGHPTYNRFRSDIAALFPGLMNSGGAVGFFHIDTTKLANGIHNIDWVATDSAGHTGGIGSRNFFVSN